MKNLRTIFSLLMFFLIIIACGGNENTKSTLEGGMQDTAQQKVNPGVPLDNLHRSKAGDSTLGKKDIKMGIPLDNLERSKSPDSSSQSLPQ